MISERLEGRRLLSAQLFVGRNYNFGDSNASIVSGDYNDDHISDLAVGNKNTGSSNVTLLLGNGDGTFAEPTTIDSGGTLGYLLSEDLNADNKSDLLIVTTTDIRVLISNGNGTFKTAVTSHYSSYFGAQFCTGDFNGDGKVDLIGAGDDGSGSAGTTYTLLGNGDGTFATVKKAAYGAFPASIVAADFNADGKLDLALANYRVNTASIVLGKGDGTFAAAITHAVGTTPFQLVAGDFNRDGKPDLATINEQSSTVSVLLNSGVGVFAAAINYTVNDSPYTLTVADFNNDGCLDIAAASFTNDTVTVLTSRADGTFIRGSDYLTDANPQTLISGDWNRDGKADLASANFNSGKGDVSVLIGDGAAGFQAAPVLNALGNLSVAADFDNDGFPDLAVTGTSRPVDIQLNNGAGQFVDKGAAAPYGSYYQIIAADFNGDGNLDLVIANFSGVVVSLGNGDGTFKNSTAYSVSPYGVQSIAVGDFNRDGNLDIAAGNAYSSVLNVLLGNSTGTFTTGQSLNPGASTALIVSGDFNNDGKIDLVTQGSYGGATLLLTGNGDGTFLKSATLPSVSALSLAVDLNQDGNLDVISGNTLLLGKGNGSFTSVTLSVTPTIVADFDGDGYLDLASGGSISLGSSTGTFGSPLRFTDGRGVATGVADFNGDAEPDLVVSTGLHGTLLLFNQHPGRRNIASFVDGVLTIDAAQASGTVNIRSLSGTLLVSDASSSDGYLASSVRSVQLVGGAFAIHSDLGVGGHCVALNVESSAAAVLDTSQHLDNLAVNGAASFNVSGNNVLRSRGLSIGGNGRLDLANNSLILDYTGDSPLSSVRGYLASGRNGGAWNGSTGITSSAVAGVANSALGYGEASTILGASGGTFAGQTVDATALLVRFTLLGDANLDRTVDVVDLGRLSSNWQHSSSGWVQGDFNYDNIVDVVDLGSLSSDWQKTYTPPVIPTITKPILIAPVKKAAVSTSLKSAALAL